MQQRCIEYYNNFTVTDEVIDRMKNIVLLRNDDRDTSGVTRNIIGSLESVCCGVYDSELVNIVLGEDWFLIYVSDSEEIIIEAWVSNDSRGEVFIQTMEMYTEFKNVLLANENKLFNSYMKKTTSYNFFKKMLEKGFLEVFSEEMDLASYTPFSVIEPLLMKYGSVPEFIRLKEDYVDVEPEVDKYLFCDVEFGVTDKFVKKYKK